MSLPLHPSHFDSRQDEAQDFSKICFIPSLGLSCFGCCGHHFANKKTMEKFFDSNQEELDTYLEDGKSYREFMEREHLLDPCGGCYSLVRDKDEQGRDRYVCGVHPLRIGQQPDEPRDLRVGYCDHNYLCKTAARVNRMLPDEQKLFYEFLKEQKFTAYEYSMINSQETFLGLLYDEWLTKKEQTGRGGKISHNILTE